MERFIGRFGRSELLWVLLWSPVWALLMALPCLSTASSVFAAEENELPLVIEASLSLEPPQGWEAFHLSRALSAWADDDLQTVIEELSAIELGTDSGFEEADRAAFLLAEAYLRMGATEAFLDLAARAASAEGSAYRQWIAYRALALGSDAAIPRDHDAAPLLGAALLLEHGDATRAITLLEDHEPSDSLRALHLHLLALAYEASGRSPERSWHELAELEPHSTLDHDLVGGARLALALAALESGEDATEQLSSVPATSLHRTRALYMLALLALEEGRDPDAITALDELLTNAEAGSIRRQALLLRGSMEMDAARFAAALDRFERAELDWKAEWSAMETLENSEILDHTWAFWERGDKNGSSIPYRMLDAGQLDEEALGTVLDLRQHKSPELDSAPIEPEASSVPGPLRYHQPSANEWAQLQAVRDSSRSTELARADLEHEIDRSTAGSVRRLHYLQLGTSRTELSLEEMDRAIAQLDASLARLDTTLAAMDSLQAQETARILDRTRRLVVELDRDRLFLRAIHHFHVEGPQPKRSEHSTNELTAGQVIENEAAMAAELSALAQLFGQRMPELVNRSFDEILEPQLEGGSHTLHALLLAERSRAFALASALDSMSTRAGVDSSLLARRDLLGQESERLARRETELRRDIARRVALRGRTALEAEREALDYHLADASFERAIELTMDPMTSEQPEIVQPARRVAIGRLESFLQLHPESFARAESRFRLADLRLLQARDEFQQRMANFLGENPDDDQLNDRALAPFVDYAPAITLYRSILSEDTEFAHIDAVLFSLGMILSDDGQAEGVENLQLLVQLHPDSEHAQEAWLRQGDERFEAKDFAAAIPLLENAAQGSDPSFSAIALYKLGWSHFEEDRYLDAADGFRRLMDLYTENEMLAARTDLRDEAEEYLVHSLARGGGAEEFAPYFDQLGGRNYESRILANMGSLLKGYSLYEESIACDQLWLSRYPDAAQALELAERVVDTYGRANKTERSMQARLEFAPRFMAGGSWYETNEDPERRAAADEFAQASYREAALASHHRARESQAMVDWDEALSHYETFLQHWPQDTESGRLHYQAGEAAAELAHFDRALMHFGVAAGDTASFAQDAAWQRVATADRWYRSESDSTFGSVVSGPDSIAHKILALGDEYLASYPSPENAAELRWRQAQLAYRHAWDTEAARRFAEIAEKHPEDPRVPTGLRLRGDALHRSAQPREAALAYEDALVAAQVAGQDSLATSLRPIIPLSWYQHAEAVAASDSVTGEHLAAPHFVELARRFPEFEHADQALYRAALGYLDAGEVDPSVDAFETVLSDHPESEQARDASVQIAQAYERFDRASEAAIAFAAFSRLFPRDADAASALLKAADLHEGQQELAQADELRDEFLSRYPEEIEAAFEIREARAQRELDQGVAGITGSELAAYLLLARAHPESASPSILAQVDFLNAEALFASYASQRLTQPLPASIEIKKTKLEELLQAYARVTQRQVKLYTQASAYRIGEALIAFGDALLESERPAGLDEDELFAYDEVLEEQSWGFYDRGEDAWNQLLQQNPVGSADDGEWLARTRDELWPRVARRFVHQPTVEYPLVSAVPPAPASE